MAEQLKKCAVTCKQNITAQQIQTQYSGTVDLQRRYSQSYLKFIINREFFKYCTKNMHIQCIYRPHATYMYRRLSYEKLRVTKTNQNVNMGEFFIAEP